MLQLLGPRRTARERPHDPTRCRHPSRTRKSSGSDPPSRCPCRLGVGNELPPLVFDNDQEVAIAVALQVAPRTIAGLAGAALRALDTVLQVMPLRLRHLVGPMEVTSIWNAWELAASNVHQDFLLSVSAALRIIGHSGTTTKERTTQAQPKRSSPITS
jgi:hypothetical protein